VLQHQLIEACKKKDQRAMLQLYNTYCEGMFKVAQRFINDPFEAEDAMQEAFIKAFEKLHQFRGEVTFGAWIKKIVIHKCMDKLKANKLETLALNEQILHTVEEDHDWNIDDGVTVEMVKEKLEQLPEKYRYPLKLFLVEGYDHEEISEILGVSKVASRTLIHRGKKKLQEELKDLKHGTGY
jgi:RNA polymerase sigma factor (sigma-70 family)